MKIFNYLTKNKGISFIKNWNFAFSIMGLMDLFLVSCSFELAFKLTHKSIDNHFFQYDSYIVLYLCMLPVWFLLLHMNNITQIPRTTKYSNILILFIQFSLYNFSILSFLSILINFIYVNHISFQFLLFTSLNIFLLLYICRSIEYRLFKFYRKAGFNYRNIIIIAGERGSDLIENILNKKEWGYRIIMVISNSEVIYNKFSKSVRVYPVKAIYSLKLLFEFDAIDEIILYKEDININAIRSILKSCEEIGVEFRLFTDNSSFVMTNSHLTYLGGIPFHTFTLSNDYNLGTSIKTAFDILASFAIIVMLIPILLLFAILIKIDTPGPVIFKQARVGLRGRQFYIYKFRTMVKNAELLKKDLEQHNEMDGPVFKLTNDPRITKVGKLLRKTGLDEIPQFFNVLKGDMSFMGPRPPLASETAQYEPWQLRRLSVKPGITCYWQIVPKRNEIKFDEWVKMDLDYIDRWSIKTDIKLFFNTIRTIFASTGR